MRTVAALFVDPRGPYFGLPGVDPWDEQRDARLYAGPHPVVAHPPCERWGRYWHGGPSARERKVKGDDGGCFAVALAAVHRWGGVLEHPEASAAWGVFGINRPPREGGWVPGGLFARGWTCCVEQGHYGHRARKATWLYACDVELPELTWGPSDGASLIDAGYHSAEERAAAKARGETSARDCERLFKLERRATPVPFRDLLLSIARTAATRQEVA
jgi:hypothetical protein